MLLSKSAQMTAKTASFSPLDSAVPLPHSLLPTFFQGCLCPCADDSATIAVSQQKTRLLWITIGLLAVFFVAEWTVGFWSRSLSLQADAGHILSDVVALGLSLLATWLAKQAPSGKATFGYQRLEILAALVNGLSLLVIAALISWEAIHRWQSPETILGLPMLAIAFLGLIVNLLNITLLHPHTHNDLNLRGALLHIIADTASSVGVILAALAVHLCNWLWADAAISLVVATFTGLSALPLIQESLKVFLEYAPETINPSEVETSLNSFHHIVQVEKLHIWTISSGKVMLCAHITVDCENTKESDRLLRRLQTHLQQSFGITEITLQLTSRKFDTVIPIHPLFNQDLVAILSVKKTNSNLQHI
jgi:cobalt-zinc-cadmium efflux system protein